FRSGARYGIGRRALSDCGRERRPRIRAPRSGGVGPAGSRAARDFAGIARAGTSRNPFPGDAWDSAPGRPWLRRPGSRAQLRPRALCEQLQDHPLFFLVLWGLWMYHEVRSDLDQSLELAERLFTLAQKAQDPAQLIQAHMALMVTFLSLGEPAKTRAHAEQGA